MGIITNQLTTGVPRQNALKMEPHPQTVSNEGASKITYKSRIFRIIYSLLVLFIGTTMALALNNSTSLIGILGQSVGLAFIVTGCISVFREGIIFPSESDETKKLYDDIKNKMEKGFGDICDRLSRQGIYLLSEKRYGHPRYHRWLLETKPQHIFFAGHSVLHRVQKDFEDRQLKSVEENIEQKLSEGSHIRILFLDPTWELLNDVAKGEGQAINDFRLDLKTTLGVCQKIWKRIEGKKLAGDIEIRTCRETVQYAYHYTFCPDRDEKEMLAGFYYAGRLGTLSPLLLVEGKDIQNFFEEHFKNVFDREESIHLLTYLRRGEESNFNLPYYQRCIEALEK